MKSLSYEGCKSRRQALLERVEADIVVIINPRNLLYFANLLVSPLSFGSWGRPFLIIDGNSGNTTLVVDNFLSDAAQRAFVDTIEVWTWYDASHNPGVPVFRETLRQLKKYLPVSSGRRIGIEVGWMPYGLSLEQPVDITTSIASMQRQKYADELELIREALAVTEAAHKAVRAQLHAGMTEIELHALLYASLVEAAGFPVLLMGDIVSGERAANISGAPTTRVVQEGELIIFDVAPIVNGYRADFTATLCVGGTLTREQASIETALHDAIRAGESVLRPGAACAEIYEAVQAALNSHSREGTFPHHAGHGLGLGHPEPPYLVPNSDEVLLPGDVITLEPGLYADTWGARIEHVYCITDTGCQQLTHHQTTFTP